MSEKTTKKEVEDIVKGTSNPVVAKYASKAMKESFEGDEVAQKMAALTQILTQSVSSAGSVDEKEVEKIVKKKLDDIKVGIDNLQPALKSMIEGKPVPINVTITTSSGAVVKKSVTSEEIAEYKKPIIQKMLSDFLARNNVYLYGGAGTGKTYSADIMKRLLGWKLITISCNQFTSPLELIGGQTIDGYQEGKAVRAWGNLDENGEPIKESGCVLLLDELPKIDPNTAGILNQMLAKISELRTDPSTNKKIIPTIQNARGQDIPMGNVFVIATGNALLNESDSDYEANFKQDLSLQDRFVGSTYEVFVNVDYEWHGILDKKWAFIFIYFNKLRRAIEEENLTSKAFVSIRIMQSAQKTYNTYRRLKEGSKSKSKNVQVEDAYASYTPVNNENALSIIENKNVKTIFDTCEEFFKLFNEDDAKALKDKTDYKGFIEIVKQKDKINDLDKLNTEEELKEVEQIIATSKA